MQAGKKYQLPYNAEIIFAMREKVFFNKEKKAVPSVEENEAKMMDLLEESMRVFQKSDHKNEVALKLILAALSEVPLYFPVEIDLEAMLGGVDPTKLKPGDILQTQQDARIRFRTMMLKDGMEFIPAFTSEREAGKGLSTSTIRYYPKDYLPIIKKMEKTMVVNLFGGSPFVVDETVLNVLLSLVQKESAEVEPKPQQEIPQKKEGRLVGTTVDGRYSVLKMIGRGGASEIYLALDTRINKAWAIKVFDKNDKRFNELMRDMFLWEARMMMELKHPAIAAVADIVEDEKNLCIVMEYIEGESLEFCAREEGPFSEETVVRWGKELCDFLRYLHSQNPPVIYRDMKPGNIILKPDGRLKVIDFGIARRYDPKKTYDTVILGTKGYAAPEQYGGRQTDARTDIFALGMVMHHLVTGVDPKEIPETKPIREINPNLSPTLEEIILKCTEMDPDKRYQSCEELMAALECRTIEPTKKKGFFGKLFEKSTETPKQNETVRKLYIEMKEETRKSVFYGGFDAAENLLLSLAKGAFGNVAPPNIRRCFEIYLQTWIRTHGGFDANFSTPDYIKKALCKRFSAIETHIVSKCVDLSLQEIYRHEPELKRRAEMVKLTQKYVASNAVQNKNVEETHMNDPEYGVIPEKPIFVAGFGWDREYLGHLYTENGVKLTFDRVGSLNVKGIAGPVDMYRLLLPDRTEYMKIYICNYGTKNTKAVPRGLKYVE
ncbi:MAG: protein kinase [Oscillospiraceae bacterium]|nr:protein kinase [Oscillospiraceae bacterium]